MMDRCEARCTMGDYRWPVSLRCEGWAGHSGAHWHTMYGCEPVAALRWHSKCTDSVRCGHDRTESGTDLGGRAHTDINS